MKRKFILRLLAVVMAASLTATSVPSELFSYGTETVYAATNKDATDYTTAAFVTTASTIDFLKTDSSKAYGVVVTGQGDSSKATYDDSPTRVSGTRYTIATGLKAYTSYDVYVADASTHDNAKFICTVKTAKLSLTDETGSAYYISGMDIDNDGSKTADNPADVTLTFNGQVQKPTVLEVTVPKDGNPSNTEKLTGSEIWSNFEPATYENATNVGAYDDADKTKRPTVVLKAKETSKYEGYVYGYFTIDKFTLTNKNTQIEIGGQVYGGTNTPSFPYDGTGQDSVLQSIKVSADLDGDGTYETKLTRNTDYEIDFTETGSTNDTTATYGDTGGLNVTTDHGTVTLKFTGKGNYTEDTTPVVAKFSISQSTPDTPTKPTLKQDTDLSFIIDTSDEDQRYTYEYMILTEDEKNSAITWEDASIITSEAVGGSVTSKATKITITTDAGSTTATSDYAEGCGTVTSMKSMSGKTLVLNSYTNYYVVRRIKQTVNVKGTQTSEKASVKTKKIALSKVVKSTNYVDATGDNNQCIGESTPKLDKIYDGKDQKDVEVILYAASGQKGSTLTEGVDYTIEYWNILEGSTATYTAGTPTGQKGDKKSAGTVYVWAVGNETNFSGAILIGYYEIAQQPITLVVKDNEKPYDSTDEITGLEASATSTNGETVFIKGITGHTTGVDVYEAGWGLKDGDTYLTVPTSATKSDNINNFDVSFDVSKTKINITKQTVEILGPDSITVKYGQKIKLGQSANVSSLSGNLQYTLSYSGAGDGDVATHLTLGGEGGTDETISLDDYVTIKEATDIKVTVTLKNVQSTSNYSLGKTSKDITITIKPADVEVGFANAKDGVITVDAYTRRTEVKKAVETAIQTAVATDGTKAQAGIDTTGSASANKGELVPYKTATTAGYYIDTVGTNYYNTADSGTKYANVIYKYYKGNTELYDVPTESGEYTVKAFLKENSADQFKGNVIGTDGTDSTKFAGQVKLVIKGGSSSNSTGSSEGVDDYYENTDDGKIYDKNDQLVTNQVVNLDGTDKYVGSDGKVVTGKVLVDDAATGNTYAIAKDGSLIKNNKTTIGGKDYVTDENGAVLKDQLATTPSGNTVYVGKDGAVVKNQVVTVNKKKYYANSTGRIVKNGFFNTKRGNKVYADKNGVLKVGVVFTVKGYKYYAGTNGAIATNGLTKTKSGNTVFATSSGKLKVNKTFTYKGVKYKANKKGVVTKVK